MDCNIHRHALLPSLPQWLLDLGFIISIVAPVFTVILLAIQTFKKPKVYVITPERAEELKKKIIWDVNKMVKYKYISKKALRKEIKNVLD